MPSRAKRRLGSPRAEVQQHVWEEGSEDCRCHCWCGAGFCCGVLIEGKRDEELQRGLKQTRVRMARGCGAGWVQGCVAGLPGGHTRLGGDCTGTVWALCTAQVADGAVGLLGGTVPTAVTNTNTISWRGSSLTGLAQVNAAVCWNDVLYSSEYSVGSCMLSLSLQARNPDLIRFYSVRGTAFWNLMSYVHLVRWFAFFMSWSFFTRFWLSWLVMDASKWKKLCSLLTFVERQKLDLWL